MDRGDRGGAEVRLELGQLVAAWPLGASLAAAVAMQGLRAGRRRTALNEALHELRRPLQALALAIPGPGQSPAPALHGSVQMAATALERLEREINGDSVASVRRPIFMQPLLDAAAGRWRSRAALAGGSLTLRWRAGEAMIDADRGAVAQAIDNLIVNAIEHGGPEVVVEARTSRGRLRVAVVDSGRRADPDSRRDIPAELIAQLTGRRLRGHGLRLVRRTAAAHGGDFRLHSTARGTEAILELPLSVEGRAGA